MPNIVANRITIESKNAKDIIHSLLTLNEATNMTYFDFNKVIRMPSTIANSDKWIRTHWGCNNTLYTSVNYNSNTIEFETPWSPCLPVIEKIAKMYPNSTITYEYSFEETGYNVGKYIYMNGHLKIMVDIEPFTKEAYELHFDLWGKDDAYMYSKEEDNYVFKTKNLNFYELVDSAGNKLKLYPIIRKYTNNGRLAVALVDERYELFTYLTINIQYDLSNNNDGLLAFIDTNNEKWAENYIEKYGLAIKTGFYGLSGYCVYPEYRFNLSKLNEESE